MIGLDMTVVRASNVAPAIMERVIHAESRGDPLTLNVNVKWTVERDEKGQPITVTDKDGQPEPKQRKVVFKWPIEVETKQDATTVAYAAVVDGSTVDMSYMRMNGSDLSTSGFIVEDMFDSCKNLTTGVSVLSVFYAHASKKYPDPQITLRVTLSAYNTDDFNKGYPDGYSARYRIGNPAVSVPVISSYTADATVFVRQLPEKEEAMSTKEEANSTQQTTEPAKAVTPRVDPVVSQSQGDDATSGVQVEHTADAAEASGMFHETAMSESDVWESNTDSADDSSGTAVMLKGKVVRPAVSCSATGLVKAQSMKGGN